MDGSPLEAAMIAALQRLRGSVPRRLDADSFLNENAPDLEWLPPYLFAVNEEVWAIEIVRNDQLSEETAREMQRASQQVPGLHSAVFIPPGEIFSEAQGTARTFGLAMIVEAERGHVVELLPAPTEAAPQVPPRPSRIPPKLCEALRSLSRVEPSVRAVLTRFTDEHEALQARGTDEESETQLLKETVEQLLACDQRFGGSLQPLLSLRRLEEIWEFGGLSFRDHFFHSFHDFLLGCLVMDRCPGSFEAFLAEAFPDTSDMSIEYVWLLVALYHDVGYLAQRGEDVIAMRFGSAAAVNFLTGEREAVLAENETALKHRMWQQYALYRRALTSLYDHVIRPKITCDWAPDALSPPQAHPLDQALQMSFLSEESHGAASAFRLLADISEYIGRAHSPDRPFLQKHAYLAALSVPFHDWHVRREMVEQGIYAVRTSRFPFAALLMFIDTLQDDRREPLAVGPENSDLLEGLVVEDDTVSAVIDVGRLDPGRLEKKRREAAGVLEFLDQDGLKFRYPKEFV